MKSSWVKLLNIGVIIIAPFLLASCANNTIINPSEPPIDIVPKPPSTPEDKPGIVEQGTLEQSPATDISEVPELAGEPHFIVTKYQLLPPPEQNYDADFEKAYNDFVSAVYRKDLTAIDGFLDDEILNSFGDGGWGKGNFYKSWGLNQDPEQSTLWIELEKIIQLGGIYNAEERYFVAPYIFSTFPDEFDAFEYFAIIDKRVNVYEEEDIDARVIDTLSYNIIKRISQERTEQFNAENRLIMPASEAFTIE